MQAKPTLLVAFLAASLTTACYHKTVKMALDCSNLPCLVKACPDPVKVSGHGKFTVKWKSPTPGAWLIDFPDGTPCEGGDLIQSGRVSSCVIDACNMKKDFKYYAASAGHMSADPAIAHDTARVQNGCPSSLRRANIPAPTPPAPTTKITFFCLDVTSGSPKSCNNGENPKPGDPADPLPNVSAQDLINFQMTSGATVTIDHGACDDGDSFSSAQPICRISKTAGQCSPPGAYCAYNYRVSSPKGGPFQIQVKSSSH